MPDEAVNGWKALAVHGRVGRRQGVRASLFGGASAVSALATVALLCAGSASAGPIRVVELFTSQGCPKCPPADRLITELAKEPDTIALSFAVNYWDYIGWKDTLASPVFTARQHAYAKSRGDRRIFTPQVIVDGRGCEAGADKVAIVRDMHEHAEADRGIEIPLALAERDGALNISIGEGKGAVAPLGVYVLRVARQKTVEIGRGENSGRSVTYTNAVRAMTKIGEWTGKTADFHLVELKGDDEGYVVLLQAGSPEKPGAILAAAKTGDL